MALTRVQIEENLLESSLWKNKLLNDCNHQKIFLSNRNNNIALYYKGGKLFSFNGDDYSTHIKYAAVIESKGKDYLTETELRTHKLLHNFENSYERIKENCKQYSGVEATGVSEIYNKHSYLSGEDIIVLDVEVSFKSNNENKKQDRIDILLFDKETKTLQFVEAKHISNNEIWSTNTPKVISQIKRYEEQIKVKKTEILKRYEKHINSLNHIFNTTLPIPEKIDSKVTLLIFGFDTNQRTGRIDELIIKNPAYKGMSVYPKGNTKGLVIKNLWNANSKIL